MENVLFPKQRFANVGLLVSVRSAAEFQLVAELGIDVIDFKEPRRGALAAADPELWRQAASQLRPGFRLSAALGEWNTAIGLADSVPRAFSYAKAGPAGIADLSRLVDVWMQLRDSLSPDTQLVAVAYADHDRADCPAPEAIFQAAAMAGIETWLLDTFDKQHRVDSISLLGIDRLAAIEQMAEQARSQWVLAGSVNLHAASELLHHGVEPTMFGVRGDVCDGSRGGQIVPDKIVNWLQLLRSLPEQVDHRDDRRSAHRQAEIG
jgi:(5-formylfuran-3-yl)methyl phosphate synthase